MTFHISSGHSLRPASLRTRAVRNRNVVFCGEHDSHIKSPELPRPYKGWSFGRIPEREVRANKGFIFICRKKRGDRPVVKVFNLSVVSRALRTIAAFRLLDLVTAFLMLLRNPDFCKQYARNCGASKGIYSFD